MNHSERAAVETFKGFWNNQSAKSLLECNPIGHQQWKRSFNWQETSILQTQLHLSTSILSHFIRALLALWLIISALHLYHSFSPHTCFCLFHSLLSFNYILLLMSFPHSASPTFPSFCSPRFLHIPRICSKKPRRRPRLFFKSKAVKTQFELMRFRGRNFIESAIFDEMSVASEELVFPWSYVVSVVLCKKEP